MTITAAVETETRVLNVDDGEKFALGTEEQQRGWQQTYRELIEREFARRPLCRPQPSAQRRALQSARQGQIRRQPRRSRHAARSVSCAAPIPMRASNVSTSHARGQRPACIVCSPPPTFPTTGCIVGSLVKDTPILAKDVVRHVGEPIVAIAAETLEAAHAAAEMVDIDYEPLDARADAARRPSRRRAAAPSGRQSHRAISAMPWATSTRRSLRPIS